MALEVKLMSIFYNNRETALALNCTWSEGLHTRLGGSVNFCMIQDVKQFEFQQSTILLELMKVAEVVEKSILKVYKYSKCDFYLTVKLKMDFSYL